jgi:hypothetical protein
MKTTRSKRSILGVAIGVISLCAAPVAQAHVTSAAAGEVVNGDDAGCITMSYGKMKNECSHVVSFEIPLSVSETGNYRVALFMSKSGAGYDCLAYTSTATGANNVQSTPAIYYGTVFDRLEFPLTYVGVDSTLNVACRLKSNQAIARARWVRS